MARSRPVWFGENSDASRPRLSRDRIVETAVRLLDGEGVDGFSMRRLATRLDAGTMSLYEYVSGKEDVLDLALDAVLGEVTPEPADTVHDWRARITHQMTRTREAMRRHPWVPALIATRPLLGPNALARSERVHAVLLDAGFHGADLVAAVSALSSYVHGFTVQQNMWLSRMRDPEEERVLRHEAQDYVAQRAGDYPALAWSTRLEDTDFDGGFERGLRIILDGIACHLTS